MLRRVAHHEIATDRPRRTSSTTSLPWLGGPVTPATGVPGRCVGWRREKRAWLTPRVDDLPGVEMLWESAAPGQELTNRFGFPDGAAAATWVADVLGRYWELDVVRCDRLVISGR